jgi:hypothetical protein
MMLFTADGTIFQNIDHAVGFDMIVANGLSGHISFLTHTEE